MTSRSCAARKRFFSFLTAMFERNPLRIERWMRPKSGAAAGGSARRAPRPHSARTSVIWRWMSSHSRMRLNERKFRRQKRRAAPAPGWPPLASWKRSHRASRVKKSECGWRKAAWARSASAVRSAGRSRGSGRLSAAAMTLISRRQPSRRASISMRDRRGSSGMRAIRRPVSVSSTRAAPRRPRPVGPSLRPLGDGPELDQQPEPVGDAPGLGPVDEGELRRVAEVERDHAQDDLGQVGAQDLGGGELGPAAVVLLRVEPDAQPRGRAAAAALALVGAAARDGHDRHGGRPRARGVARDAGEARVHDRGDARDGD